MQANIYFFLVATYVMGDGCMMVTIDTAIVLALPPSPKTWNWVENKDDSEDLTGVAQKTSHLRAEGVTQCLRALTCCSYKEAGFSPQLSQITTMYKSSSRASDTRSQEPGMHMIHIKTYIQTLSTLK